MNDEEDEENEEDDDDIDVPNQEDLALIEEMLNRGGQGSDSLDEDLYGNEDGEDGEEDDYYLEWNDHDEGDS